MPGRTTACPIAIQRSGAPLGATQFVAGGNGTATHPPRRRQLDRERYAANRESVLSAKRQCYASDPTFANIVRAQNRDAYQRNRDKRRAHVIRYRQEHGDELRARERARNRRTYAQDPAQRSTTTSSGGFEISSALVPTSVSQATSVALRAPEATSHLRSGERCSPRTNGTARIAARPSASRPITGFRSIAAARTRSATSCLPPLQSSQTSGGLRRSSARFYKPSGRPRCLGPRRRTRAAALRYDQVIAEDLRPRHFVEKALDAVDDRESDTVAVVEHQASVVAVGEETHF
jgi:hypothetical protein